MPTTAFEVRTEVETVDVVVLMDAVLVDTVLTSSRRGGARDGDVTSATPRPGRSGSARSRVVGVLVGHSTASAIHPVLHDEPDLARALAENVLGALQRRSRADIPDQYSFVTSPWTPPPERLIVSVPLSDDAESDTDPCSASSRG